MKKTLDYHQTLEMVENFMIKTGIRDFCSNICKGRCCYGCYDSEHACHKNEGRRLSCSAFVCVIPEKDLDRFLRMTRNYVMARIDYALDGWPKPSHGMPRHSLYFSKQPAILFTNFEADRTRIESFYVHKLDEVKEIINQVMVCWNKVPTDIPNYSRSHNFDCFSMSDSGKMRCKIDGNVYPIRDGLITPRKGRR